MEITIAFLPDGYTLVATLHIETEPARASKSDFWS